jgi:hypothetical protein
MSTAEQDPRRTIRKFDLMGLALSVTPIGDVSGWVRRTSCPAR